MSKIYVFTMLFLSITCFGIIEAQEKFVQNKWVNDYVSFGEEINVQNVLGAYQMQERYDVLMPGDTINVTFHGRVTEVCKNKGCWMKMALEDGREIMVKFKDYGFFVPRDINMGTAMVNGKAYVEEMSVEEQRHYAEDAGMSPKEVSQITNPRKTLSFIAEGVEIKKER